MKIPKSIKRFCPSCRKHTEVKVVQLKTGTKRGSLKRGSIQRAKKRGLGVGFGNKGRWGSKPTKPKMTGAKTSKKTYLKYTCKVCNKSTMTTAGIRTKKLEIV
ncbi:50S ribosomal protein L44e [Candidatus Woesearchaeota archaeon]|nr:50S ribosomal protein L44e [Candidatus Woesearchaeota archaeon]